jgi:hypothetical protein
MMKDTARPRNKRSAADRSAAFKARHHLFGGDDHRLVCFRLASGMPLCQAIHQPRIGLSPQL